MAKRTRRNPPIDALRALAADPNVVDVRVGGRTVATLPRARAEALGATEGAAWTPALATRVGGAAAEALAREAALAFLARRAWSAALLAARLVRAGHDERAAADAVEVVGRGHAVASLYTDGDPAALEMVRAATSRATSGISPHLPSRSGIRSATIGSGPSPYSALYTI
jgi:hypothetical protein